MSSFELVDAHLRERPIDRKSGLIALARAPYSTPATAWSLKMLADDLIQWCRAVRGSDAF
jgi:hypothetical protein